MSAESINDGARALLKETVSILSDFPDVEYMVIGGWCPYIRNESKEIIHPGTMDVDLLFKDSYRSGAIQHIFEAYLEAGFMPSAKHQFQLMKPQDIGGRSFVFNIDFLHPGMQNEGKGLEMFVDHFDFEMPTVDGFKHISKGKSIALPNSASLFNFNLHTKESIDGVPFNLVTFDGMLITKMDSCQKKKRERDSFDIYLGFECNKIDVENVKKIAGSNALVNESLENFKRYLSSKAGEFNGNVQRYHQSLCGSPAKEILARIR